MDRHNLRHFGKTASMLFVQRQSVFSHIWVNITFMTVNYQGISLGDFFLIEKYFGNAIMREYTVTVLSKSSKVQANLDGIVRRAL